MTNLDSILKSRDFIWSTKLHLVKAMVFPLVTYGCDSWTIKKAECQRIDAFELWCWRRLLRVTWTARRSNQSILKEITPGWSLVETNVEAETPKFWPPDAKSWLIWKDPDAGKDWGQEDKSMTEDEMVGWHHWLNGHGFGWALVVGDGQGGWRVAIHGVATSQTRLSDWTELMFDHFILGWLPGSLSASCTPATLPSLGLIRKITHACPLLLWVGGKVRKHSF